MKAMKIKTKRIDKNGKIFDTKSTVFRRSVLDDELEAEQNQVIASTMLLNKMHADLSNQHVAAFEQDRFTHLPDIVITGRKKCGTKALLTFLLQHPKIVGSREEFHWHSTSTFNHDFKAFLGALGSGYILTSLQVKQTV